LSSSGYATRWVSATASARQFSFGALIGLGDDLEPSDFVTSAGQVLDRLSRTEHCLLVVDDAHLLDDASATLLHHLALGSGPVALLATRDAGEPCPDAITALAKDDLLEVIELAPLDYDAVTEVLSATLDGDVELATAAQLFELSEGNPFVLREPVDAAKDAGTLTARRGVWCWRGTLQSNPRLEDLMTRRLQRAGPEVRRVLELLSLAEPLDLAELEAAAGREAVAAAEADGLITFERGDGHVEARVAQVLYAQLVRAELGHARKLDVLRTLDDVLERFPAGRPVDSLKRALIRLEIALPRPDDVECFTEAARLARPDHPLAARFARAALDAGAGFTAFDYLIDALLWQGRIAEAREVVASIPDDLEPSQHEYFTLRWSRMLWWMAGERPQDPADTSPASDDDRSPATVARQVGMAAAAGRAPEVLATALNLLDDPAADNEARCWAAGAAMIGLGGQGQVNAALALTGDAYERARRLSDFNYRLLLSVIEIWLRRSSGDLQGAELALNDLRRAETTRPPTGPVPNAGLLVLFDALLVLTSGRARASIPMLRDAAALLDDIDFAGLSASAHYGLAEAMVLTGDRLGAAAQLGLGAEAEERTLDIFRPGQLRAKAWASMGSAIASWQCSSWRKPPGSPAAKASSSSRSASVMRRSDSVIAQPPAS
jgi:tetratricopeptide (TPR) repeat protein